MADENQVQESATHHIDSDEVSLLDLLIVLAKYKRLVLGFPIAAALAGAAVSFLLPNKYIATARILPPQQQAASAAMMSQLGFLANLAGGPFGVRSSSDLYVGLLKSRTVADELIHSFNLKTLYDRETLDDTRNELERITTITSGRDGIISIEVEDKDPKRAAQMANAYVDNLNRLTQIVAVTEAAQRRVFFDRQLATVKDQLANAEIELKRTQETTGLIKLDEQGRAIIENVARLRGQIAAKEVQLTAMRTFAAEKNPDLIIVQQELAGLRTQLARVERERGSREGDIFVPTGRVPEVGLEYLRKLRDVKYYETIFELLAKQLELAKIDEAKEGSIVQVVDKAIEPDKKTKPRRLLITFITGFAALLLAVISAIIKEGKDRAEADPRRAERVSLLRKYLKGR